uniref:ABC transmembrane type-1 domain-containing protein n=1 Tax=Panagrolaimus sp. ES5 TaxID=591445 RepID=A0AC34FII6_9BILA
MSDKKTSEFEVAWDTQSEPIEAKPEKVSLVKLWRYATGKSLILVILGASIAVVTGAGMPLMSIIVGDLSESFVKMTKLRESPDSLVCPQDPSCNTTFSEIYTAEDFHNDILNQCTSFAVLGAAVYIAAFIQVSCFLISGEQMIHRMRLAFFRGILHQDISWFDKNNSGTLTTKLFDNLERVKEGTGDKVGLLIQFLSQFFTGFIIAFTYDSGLYKCMKNGIRKSILVGICLAATFIIIFASYCLAFWVGTSFVADGKMDPKTLFTVFFSVLMGSIALGQAGQQFAVIGTAQGAASAIFEIIDRVKIKTLKTKIKINNFKEPEIDCYSSDGIRFENVKGKIVIDNIRFSYPTRKDIKILKGISFEADPGQTVALVGSSGCGKSTIVQLLLRYYNPDSGNVRYI